MNVPVATLIEALRRSLRDVVQPELKSDHARSQLAAVLDILGKIEGMTDWLPAMQREEEDELRKGLDAVEARLARAKVLLPAALPSLVGDSSEACQHRFRQITDWLFDSDLESELRSEISALLRAALRESLAVTRRRIPRTDFSSMTASSE